jgi:CBS domain containing-hemolysin-like protein
MTSLILVAGSVLVISAACSLFEAVLYAVPRSHVEGLDRAGRLSGRVFVKLRQQIDRPIAAILSLNTIANTGGGALAGALAAATFGASNVVYFSIVFTLAILVFSEVVPKTVGVVHARRLVGWIALPLQGLTVLFRPLTALTETLTKVILPAHREHKVTDDELLTLVGMGLRSGDFKTYEAQVITNVLKLEKKTARDVLTPRTVVFALDASMTAKQAGALEGLTYSRVPVFDGNIEDVVGIVHRVDILTAVAQGRGEVPLESLMRPIHFEVESKPLDQLFQLFINRRRHMAAVIDEFGGLVGIVTLEDVLEELIGHQIVDESDQVPDMRVLAHQRRDEIRRRTAAGGDVTR